MSAAAAHSNPARFGLPLLLLLLALALVALALPRLRASLAWLPLDTALARHWAGETPPPPEQLDALSQRAKDVLTVHDHPRYHDGLSVITYLQAQQAELAPDARRTFLQQSEAAALATVSRAPMRPAGWLRLALARRYLDAPAQQVLEPVVMSVYTGRVEPTLQLLRLELFYGLQGHLDADTRRLLVDQTLLSWRLQPRELTAAIRARRIPYERVAHTLAATHPGVMDEIDEAIRGAVR